MNLRTEVVTNYKTAQKMDFCSLWWGIYHIYLTSLVIKAERIIKEEGSEFFVTEFVGFQGIPLLWQETMFSLGVSR